MYSSLACQQQSCIYLYTACCSYLGSLCACETHVQGANALLVMMWQLISALLPELLAFPICSTLIERTNLAPTTTPPSRWCSSAQRASMCGMWTIADTSTSSVPTRLSTRGTTTHG